MLLRERILHLRQIVNGFSDALIEILMTDVEMERNSRMFAVCLNDCSKEEDNPRLRRISNLLSTSTST
jgi:hypothetical protein